jgi:hypothetical protein
VKKKISLKGTIHRAGTTRNKNSGDGNRELPDKLSTAIRPRFALSNTSGWRYL